MNQTKRLAFCALLTILIILAASERARYSFESLDGAAIYQTPQPKALMRWDAYGQIATLIGELPAWTEDGSLDDEGWQSIINLAHVLQQIQPEDVERALIVYMNSLSTSRPPVLQPDPNPHTKPLLLIRTMLQLPEDSISPSIQRELNEWQLPISGGFVSKPLGDDSASHRFLSDPIVWRDGRPTLVARRVHRGVAYTGPLVAYDPPNEFRFLMSRFQYRNLNHLATPGLNDWYDLWNRRFSRDDRDDIKEEEKDLGDESNF